MCTTVQYFFNCGHRATHRFRNGVCIAPKSRDCRISDNNKFLATSCRRCIRHGYGWPTENHNRPEDAKDSKDDDIWYIPARCFIDVGFQTLDPFGTEPEPEPLSPVYAQQPKTPITPTKTQSLWTQFGSRNDKGPGEGLFARLKRPKRPSPCCEHVAQYGGYEAMRLEGYQDRSEGRIMDNHCQSMI